MCVIDAIETPLPDERGVRVWYLGGNSLVLQTATARLYIDPFLVTAVQHDGFFRRRGDPPVIASEVHLLDGILITHEHRDHCNPITLRELLSRAQVPVIAPRLSIDIVKSVAPAAAARTVRAGDHCAMAGLDIDVCSSGDTTAADAVSYLIQYDGLRLYVAGDALFLPELAVRIRQRLDAVFLPIAKNPKDQELYLSPAKWAEIVRQLSPRYAVPVHWDVWADYYFDPSELKRYCSSGNLTIIPVGGYLDLRSPIPPALAS